MRVLLADDEAVSRRMLESLLPMWGYEVVTASDGETAWSVLEAPRPPRLAIIDWVMPGIDGLEVTRRIRQRLRDRYVYVLLLTARDSKADVVEGLEAGADDYIAKPFDPHELRVRMDAARRAVTAHDQLERLASELTRKNEKLAVLTDTAHRFVDNVSHEFRTPLTVIKEFASILADGLGGPVTEEQSRYLGTITHAARDLSEMVDDLLDSSKLRAGTLRIDRRAHRLADLVRTAVTMTGSKARAKGIEIVPDIDRDVDTVFADHEKAGRILVNLLTNAIKFAPDGSRVTVAARTAASGEVHVSVIDEGPGLAAADLKLIFDRFRQVGRGCDPSIKGFGLGLNIARELTWLNLGTIRVSSEEGQGCTFTFTLPSDDRALIADLFLERIGELPDARSYIAALRITPAGACTTPEEVHAFVTGSCYPTDLVLDGSTPGECVVVGVTDSPQRWQERIEALRQRSIEEHASDPPPALNVACIGSWPYEDGHEHVAAVIRSTGREVVACA